MNNGGPGPLAAALARCDTTSKDEVYLLAHKDKALQLGFSEKKRAPKKKPRQPKKAAAAPAPAPPPALPPAAAEAPV